MDSLSLFLALLLLIHEANSLYPYSLLGSVPATKPAFANLGYFGPSKDPGPPSLIVTSFNPIPFFGTDYIFQIPSVDDDLANWNNTQLQQITESVTWPNEATPVPYEIFNREVLAVGGGFLVPGKSTGAVNLFLMDTNPPTGPIQISTDKFEYFYHQVSWLDMNGDGLKDVVTARAIKPIFGSASGELLWLEHPSSGALNGTPWREHVLFSGPEFFFQFYDLDNDGQLELLVTEFFGAQLALFWNWTNPQTVQSRTIDSSIGPTFDLGIVDLNNDGRPEVLVTNHVNNASLSGVYAYEIPKNIKKDKWIRHDLATGFETLVSGTGQASPGKAVAFYPRLADAGKTKPVILLGGDGSEKAYLVVPNSEDPTDWSYTVDTFLVGGGTVGQVCAGDVNGDGWSEFFVPMYDDGLLWAYTFSPSNIKLRGFKH